MNTLRKYLLSVFGAIALSLTLANVTAMAYCPEVDETEDNVCYLIGEDEWYCYYCCFCMTLECEMSQTEEDCEVAEE